MYDGTGSAQTINNGIDLDGEGGMVWTKSRSISRNHSLHDSAKLFTCKLRNGTNAEYCDATQMASFNSNGFTVGTDGSATPMVMNIAHGLSASALDFLMLLLGRLPPIQQNKSPITLAVRQE